MASRFWVLGTGTWDATTTTNWSATSNGAGGASVPVAADTVTFDANSGGGVVTVNTTVTINSLTIGAFTGTLDFSANNNNATMSTFSLTGAGTRTLNLGSGTFTLTGTGTPWNAATVTGLTFNAGTSSIVLSATTAVGRTFAGGGLTYGSVTIGANTSMGVLAITGANTFANLTVGAPGNLYLPSSTTTTITGGTLSAAGSSGNRIALGPNNLPGSVATISQASGSVALTYCSISDITVTGGATFTATGFNLGRNTGFSSFTEPAGGGSTGSNMFGC